MFFKFTKGITMKNKIEFTRVNNDTNGNPRYVCHFYNLISKEEQIQIDLECKARIRTSLKGKKPCLRVWHFEVTFFCNNQVSHVWTYCIKKNALKAIKRSNLIPGEHCIIKKIYFTV